MGATFTRKHYTEIARVLHGVRDTAERKRLTEEFEKMFRKDNPAFDAARFSSAVGEAASRTREVRETVNGIRSYGPGKFSTILDGYAYEMTQAGIDEEESEEDGGGWYGLIRLDDAARDIVQDIAEKSQDKLTPEEEAKLDESVAIIFHERSDGIVEVDWFDDEQDAEDEWADIQEQFEQEEEVE